MEGGHGRLSGFLSAYMPLFLYHFLGSFLLLSKLGGFGLGGVFKEIGRSEWNVKDLG